MSRLLPLTVLLVGCHLAVPLSGAGDTDAGSSDAPAVADAGPLDLQGGEGGSDALPRLGTPRAVAELNTQEAEDDPTLTADMLEIYFERGQDIWRATRAAANDPWGAPVVVAELSSPEEDGTPEIAGDGLTIYIGSTRDAPAQPVDIYVATRSESSDSWTTPARVPELSWAASDNCATPAADGLTLMMDSDRSVTATGRDLYVALRPAESLPWAAPVPAVGLNSDQDESGPFLADSRVLVLFGSDRPDGSEMHIWYATRTDPLLPWASPQRLPRVNVDGARDADPWLSPDGTTLYFASDRAGSQDIYVVRVE